jgi:RNA polymerase II subunit A-like phosphatase
MEMTKVPISTSSESGSNSLCSHGVIHHGLCALCGKDLTLHAPELLLKTVHMSQASMASIFLRPEEAKRLERETASRLLKERRLSLVVDLDQTLLHASMLPDIETWISQPDHIYYKDCRDIIRIQLEQEKKSSFTETNASVTEIDPSRHYHYIKLRHGVREFLNEIHSLYELHIYTMGTRSYAEAVARLLDPTKELFHDRIVARDSHLLSGSKVTQNGNGWTKKELTRIFPCDDTMVAILDDRLDVWERSPNLIQVRPYEFFIHGGDIHDPFVKEKESVQQPSTLSNTSSIQMIRPTEKSIDESDDQLERVTSLLVEIHKRFYDAYDRKCSNLADDNVSMSHTLDPTAEDYEMDVKFILSMLRAPVLSDCHITFSGMIPLQMTDPSKSDIWKTAVDFGAVCNRDISKGTTHLVTSTLDSEKAKNALLKKTIWVLKPNWLYSSVWSWNRADEMDFIWNSKCIPTILDSEPESTTEDSQDDDAFLSMLDQDTSEDYNPDVKIDSKRKYMHDTETLSTEDSETKSILSLELDQEMEKFLDEDSSD